MDICAGNLNAARIAYYASIVVTLARENVTCCELVAAADAAVNAANAIQGALPFWPEPQNLAPLGIRSTTGYVLHDRAMRGERGSAAITIAAV